MTENNHITAKSNVCDAGLALYPQKIAVDDLRDWIAGYSKTDFNCSTVEILGKTFYAFPGDIILGRQQTVDLLKVCSDAGMTINFNDKMKPMSFHLAGPLSAYISLHYVEKYDGMSGLVRMKGLRPANMEDDYKIEFLLP